MDTLAGTGEHKKNVMCTRLWRAGCISTPTPRPAVFYGNWTWAARTITRCDAPNDDQFQIQPQRLLLLGYPITVVPPSLPREANPDVRAALRPARRIAQGQPAPG